MKRLVNCLGKLVGKLITKTDADFLVNEARSYEAEGLSPIEAERMAVQDALEQTDSNGESVLNQIQTTIPQALESSTEYWNRETVRKVGAPFARAAVPAPAAPVVETPGALTPAVELPAVVSTQPEAAPPVVEAPAAQLTPEQQKVVASVPENQRAKLQAAFQPDTIRDPSPPLDKRAEPVSPEKNPVIAQLSKYGVLDPDATTRSVLEKIAADKTQPRWMRTMVDLLLQLGDHSNVQIEVVNLPNANWPALYASSRGPSQPSRIFINLAMQIPKADLARSIVHEVTHHLTMNKLRFGEDRVPLNETERAAKAELLKIFESIQARPEFEDEYGALNPWEFASEIFSNESLRAKLNAIKDPDSKLSMMQRIRDLIARLLYGGKEVTAGSLLEEAMRQTINVAGTRAAETGANVERADGERLLNLLNELPQFHDEIINATAPMLADMKISAKKRVVDYENTWYSGTERSTLETELDKALLKAGWKLSPEERAKFSKTMETRVKAVRAIFPKSEGWATDTIKPVGVKLKENKKGRAPDVQFAASTYSFDRDKEGNYLTRYLQGATPREQKKGVPLVENPEWHKRVEEMATVGVEKMMDLINRVGPDGKPTERAQTILDQIGWYRDMVDHLRHSYGGMSDLMADLLGTFSPMTGMKENWRYGVEALGKVMRGDYDELLSRVDKWMKEDPSRTMEGWKTLHGEKGMIVKENGKLFGQNSIHGMKALLDFWRIVQSGSAPKARNFTLNLIGNSYKATIDRWAARFLQRIHAPNYRIPTLTEADVPGEHMTGELVDKVDKGFGLGQDIFESMVAKMKAADPRFEDLTPADLQAIMWFLEKEIWEENGWTKIQGAANSARALAAAEGISRYEVGLSRDREERRVSTQDQKIHGMKLHGQLNSIAHTFATKVMDTLSMYMGSHERAFDTETLVYPEYDPQELVDHVVRMGAQADQDSVFVSRVLEDGESNENARPGLTVFLKNQVSFEDMKPAMAELEKLGIGAFTLQVDPRAKEELRPEVIAQGKPDRFNGIRVQFIPEFSENPEADRRTMQKAMIAATKVLQEHGNVSYIGSYRYDTLVFKKGEYDPSGTIGGEAANERRDAWLGRARDAHDQARIRRDEAKALIERREEDAKRIEREQDRLEAEQLAEISSRIEEGDEGVTAAQAQDYERQTQEPIIDPVTGRPSLVRSLALAEADAGGVGFPEGSLPHPGIRRAGGGKIKGGARAPSLWQTLGGAFRSREGEVHRSLARAGGALQRLNPRENQSQVSQRLFDYLTNPGKEITDPGIADEIRDLREQIPVVDREAFTKYKHLQKGKEASVYHDQDGRIVYKLFKVEDGKVGAYVPGQMRLDEDGNIRLAMGPKPSFQQFLNRVENVNNHGKLTPMEFVAVTPDNYAVFAQPYVVGQRVKDSQAEKALGKLNLKVLTQLGGIAAIGKVGDKYVLFDDLHQDNVRSMPGDRVEIIDAINRDLTDGEVEHLGKLGKLPEEFDTAAQEVEPQGGFYSGVAKIINRKMPNAAPAQQVKAIIKDAPQEDIKWSGVNQAIDRIAEENKGKVPKDALLDYLRDDGAVRLEEYRLGEKRLTVLPKDMRVVQNSTGGFEVETTEGRSIGFGLTPQEATTSALKWLNEGDRAEPIPQRDTRYSQYTIPGGENYREVVLTMPSTDVRIQRMDELKKLPHTEENIAEYDRLSTETQGRSAVQYTSSHFPDVPNYVAHARMNDRTDAEGKPGLFLEEIQSDRHQAGREKGYAGEVVKYHDAYYVTEDGSEVSIGMGRTAEEAKKDAGEYWADKVTVLTRPVVAKEGIADAPFRKDWPLAMFKRALRDAVATGKEWIGWTIGETQAERYDLSKQLYAIHWDERMDGKFQIMATTLQGDEAFNKPVERDGLADVVGKELANRILTDSQSGKSEETYRGIDLKVGGEGMKGFYDKMLPNEIGKYVKQWGGKVEQGELTQPGRKGAEERYTIVQRGENWDVLDNQNERRIGTYGSRQLAQEAANVFNGDLEGKPAGGVKIWKVEITPQMKETITAKGQSLFGAVAPMRAEPVQDGTDVVTNPLAPRGHLSRFVSFITGVKEQDGYRSEGHWKAGGKFNEEIQEALRTKVQNGKALMTNAAFFNSEYLNLVNKVYGKNGPTEAEQRQINFALGNTENRLTRAQAKEANRIRDPKLRAQFIDQTERDNIFLYKQEQRNALNSLNPQLRDLIVKMNDHIVLMNNGLLANADISADLKQAIDKNKGTYLHRSYQIFEDNDIWKKWVTSADPKAVAKIKAARTMIEIDVIKNKAIEHATDMKKKGTPVTRSAAVAWAKALPTLDVEIGNTLNDYLNIGDDPVTGSLSLLGGARPGSLGQAIMEQRGMVPKEIRDLWGEWENPAQNFVKTYVATGTYLENLNFQRRVLEDGLKDGYIWKKDVSAGPHPVGWVEIIPSGSKTMGILAGTYGPPILHEAFEVMNRPASKAAIQGLVTGIVSWPLMAKTVLSTGSTVRNFLGNIAFVVGNGNFQGSFRDAGVIAWGEAVKKGPTATREYVKELTELGILGDNVGAEILREMSEFAQKNNALFGKNLAKGYAQLPEYARTIWEKYYGMHKAAYSGVDSFWKIYAYGSELAKLKGAYAGSARAPSEAELKKRAAEIVRRTMPTYSEAWSLLGGASPVLKLAAPFIKFTTEVMRTSVGTIKQAKEEILSGNPKIRNIGITRLAMSTTMMTIAPMILATVTRSLFGYDDEQEEALRASLPDWQKNATLSFLPKDEKGNAQFFDLSYMNPYKIYSNPITAVMRSVMSGNDDALIQAGVNSLLEFAKPFISEQLWLSAAIDIYRNQDSQKHYQPLFNDQDTIENKLQAGTMRILQTFNPGDFDTIARVYKGATGQVTTAGKEYKTLNELAAIGGLRVTTHDTTQGLQTLTTRFEADKGQAQKLLLGPLTNRGTIDPGEVKAGYNQANARRKALYYEMRQNYLGSLKLGLTETQAINAMLVGYGTEIRKTGLGKDDLGAVVAGRYLRYVPSKAALTDAAINHPDRYNEFMEAFQAAPPWEDISE